MTDAGSKELLEQNRLLVEKLVNSSEKKKDAWDKVSSVATALAGPLISLVIALVGWHFTNVYSQRQVDSTNAYNQAQLRLAAVSAVGPFMPYITGKDPNAKGYAVLVISRFDADLGVQLAQAYRSEVGLARIAQTGTKTARDLAFRVIPSVIPSPPAAAKPIRDNPAEVPSSSPGAEPSDAITVAKGETLTVTVTAQGKPFAATFSDPIDGAWISNSASTEKEEQSVEKRIQVNNSLVFSILIDFRPDAEGKFMVTKYDVTVKDSKGNILDSRTVYPPGMFSITYRINTARQ